MRKRKGTRRSNANGSTDDTAFNNDSERFCEHDDDDDEEEEGEEEEEEEQELDITP